jgi:hypothetical protein
LFVDGTLAFTRQGLDHVRFDPTTRQVEILPSGP